MDGFSNMSLNIHQTYMALVCRYKSSGALISECAVSSPAVCGVRFLSFNQRRPVGIQIIERGLPAIVVCDERGLRVMRKTFLDPGSWG